MDVNAISNGDGGIFTTTCYKTATIGKQHVAKLTSEYELTRALPENLRYSLPGIEEIEAELCGIHQEESGDE